MFFFKIHSRKNWHISDEDGYSYCSNARWGKEMLRDNNNNLYYEPDDSYSEVIDVSEIPEELQDKLCLSCVQKAYERRLIRVSINNH